MSKLCAGAFKPNLGVVRDALEKNALARRTLRNGVVVAVRVDRTGKVRHKGIDAP